MGTHRHHSIIITTSFIKEINEVLKIAEDLFDERQISDIIYSEFNGFYSIFIGPDGSKEERDESDLYDHKREKLIKYLENRNEDEDEIFEYCEVCYGAYEQSEIESANQIKKNYNYEVRIN